MTKWKFQDYKDFYHERAGIIESDNTYSELRIKNLAWRHTKDFFIASESENITDEEVLMRVVKFLREYIYK